MLFQKSDTLLTQAQITEWLKALRGKPYNPSSEFDVTAIFRVTSGSQDMYYFAGVNVENSDLRLSSHAEEGCIAAIATALGKKAQIVEGWVMGAPKKLQSGDNDPLTDCQVSCCGKCRQQIANLAEPSTPIHSVSLNGHVSYTTVAEFLPDAFTFRQFAPELLNNTFSFEEALSVQQISDKLVRSGNELTEAEIFAWLQSLESIDYATQTSQAVVVKLSDYHYVAGVSVEEAAYVSISAMQSAMAIAHAHWGKAVIEEVWVLSDNKNQVMKIEKKQSKTQVLTQFSAYQKSSQTRQSFIPLPLSSVQVLGEFAADDKVAINMFNPSGACRSITLDESAKLIPTFAKRSLESEAVQHKPKVRKA
jgi:cytidine deaminase